MCIRDSLRIIIHEVAVSCSDSCVYSALHEQGSTTTTILQGNITMENTSFVGNKADEGGALHTDESIVSVLSTTFSKSSASNAGGACFMKESSMTVISS